MMSMGRTRCPRYFLEAHAACRPLRPRLYASMNRNDRLANFRIMDNGIDSIAKIVLVTLSTSLFSILCRFEDEPGPLRFAIAVNAFLFLRHIVFVKFAWVLQDATRFQRAWPPDLVYNFSKLLYFTPKTLYLRVINSIIQLIGEFSAKNCLCRPKIVLFLLIDRVFTILVDVTMST